MGKTIAIVNQKGGVGKTTTSVNLAACIGNLGYKTLLVDVDPQGNATSGLGVNKKDVEKSTYDMIVAGVKAEAILIETSFKKLDLLPSNINLAGAEKLTSYICEYLIENGYSHTDRRGQEGYELWDEGLKNYREYYKNGWSGKGVDVYD
mgnify:CR=1 FL=1